MEKQKGRVLVIDDDILVLKLLKQRLEKAGFEVATRNEALGTLKAINDFAPSIVIVDLKMPAVNGDALSELVRKNTNIPVILHSSEPLIVLQEKARTSGAIGAITKTSDDALFLAQFDRLFTRSKTSMRKSADLNSSKHIIFNEDKKEKL
ncbi:MAG: response regulator [Deltaproteobacteria bacterium]|nr:response regulator [Deltaproteobacteria bacterium]